MPTTSATSLLSTLSPQLLALVEASLGDALPTVRTSTNVRSVHRPPPPTTNSQAQETAHESVEQLQPPPNTSKAASSRLPSADAPKLNPSELFGASVRSQCMVFGGVWW